MVCHALNGIQTFLVVTFTHDVSQSMVAATRAAVAAAASWVAPEMHWNLQVSGVGSTVAPAASGG